MAEQVSTSRDTVSQIGTLVTSWKRHLLAGNYSPKTIAT
jgi:hypothetical protein